MTATAGAFATLPRHMHSILSLLHHSVSDPSRTALASAQASIWGKPEDDFSECYDDSNCTSPDGKNGTDCLVSWFEACTCSRGYPKTTGKIRSYPPVCFFYVSPLSQDACAGCRGLSCTVDRWGAIDRKSDTLPLPNYRVILSPSINAVREARARRRRR